MDRISKDTEYNTKTLLDGSLDTRVYTKHASRIQVTDQVSPGNYEIKVKTAATQAEVTSGADFNSTAAIGVSGTMSVNDQPLRSRHRHVSGSIRKAPDGWRDRRDTDRAQQGGRKPDIHYRRLRI